MRQENIRYIVVHCSATRCTMDYTEVMLERDHKARGFRHAGYHFYVVGQGALSPFALSTKWGPMPEATTPAAGASATKAD